MSSPIRKTIRAVNSFIIVHNLVKRNKLLTKSLAKLSFTNPWHET